MSEENKNIINNVTDSTDTFEQDDISKNKGLSAISYLGILFFIPLVACPDSKFARFHANQGLILLLFGIGIGIANAILSAIIWAICWSALNLWTICTLLTGLFSLACYGIILALAIIGIVNAVNGKAKDLPVIGKIRMIK